MQVKKELVTRAVKGEPLTHDEMDANFLIASKSRVNKTYYAGANAPLGHYAIVEILKADSAIIDGMQGVELGLLKLTYERNGNEAVYRGEAMYTIMNDGFNKVSINEVAFNDTQLVSSPIEFLQAGGSDVTIFAVIPVQAEYQRINFIEAEFIADGALDLLSFNVSLGVNFVQKPTVTES